MTVSIRDVCVLCMFTMAVECTSGQCERSWQPVGDPLGACTWFPVTAVNCVEVLDVDGPGGHSDELIAGGSFTHPTGGSENIAIWDGYRWTALGTGVSGTFSMVHEIEVHDEDGEGPLPPALYVAGRFQRAGNANTINVARWNGAEWSSVGGGPGGTIILALASFDPDGPGGQPPLLVAGGNLNTPGAASPSHLAVWDGSTWERLDSIGTVSGSCVFDSDAAGGQLPLLFLSFEGLTSPAPGGGYRYDGFQSWNGQSWSDPISLPYYAYWDGPLEVVQSFQGTSDRPLIVSNGETGPMCWNGQSWTTWGPEWSCDSTAALTFDPDGSGPLPAEFYVSKAGCGRCIGLECGLVRLSDVGWVIGTSPQVPPTVISDLASFDRDGDGPEYPELIAAGEFTHVNVGTEMRGIARYVCPAVRDGCAADVDRNGHVGMSDVTRVLSVWATAEAYADATGDSYVGFSDISAIFESWGLQCGVGLRVATPPRQPSGDYRAIVEALSKFDGAESFELP